MELETDGRTDGRTDERTNERTSEDRATQSVDKVRLSFAIQTPEAQWPKRTWIKGINQKYLFSVEESSQPPVGSTNKIMGAAAPAFYKTLTLKT